MITILHLSDTQFGAQHRFGADGHTSADQAHSTLAARLLDDVSGLIKRNHIDGPDLVVLSGDLAEQAKPSEFDQVRQFAEQLCQGLELARDRVVMVPGNHDVSWPACRAYFATCEARETRPQPPFWPKYQAYTELLDAFYQTDDSLFPVDLPWTLYRMPQLRVVVAGLNSTMAETHEVHHGYLGEAQLRWFDGQLRQYEKEGWLRVGVLHHNPIRGAEDDAFLHDMGDFARVLAPRLNVVLHGHTHQATLSRLGPDGLPVLCAGSAGVKRAQRPDEVPNQYQIVQVRGDGLHLIARSYVPAERRWIGDNRISADGDRPTRDMVIPMHHTHAIFSARLPPAVDGGTDDPATSRNAPMTAARALDSLSDRFDDLLERVAEICRLRTGPASVITAVYGGPAPLPFLRVTERVDGGATRMYPIGVCATVSVQMLDLFIDYVDRSYRAADPGVVATLVYERGQPDDEIRRRAERGGVRLQSFVEYQGIYDLSRFAAEQAEAPHTDPKYPEWLYVPQRYTLLGEPKEQPHHNLLDRILRWLAEPDERFVLVLGDFGLGKSFLLRQLARRMRAELRHVVPLLVELRRLDRSHVLDELIASHLAAAGEERIDLAKLRYLRREGRVVLLFDGFDELEQRVTYERAAAHLDTLLQAVEGQAKIVLTCRTQHFVRNDQLAAPVADRLGPVAGRRIVELANFDGEQILDFLTRHLRGDAAQAQARLAMVRNIPGLAALAENPRMLGFVAHLEEDKLRDVRSAASLYQTLLTQWLEHEYERAHQHGSPPSLTVDQRWDAVTQLAMRLWQSSEATLRLDDLSDVATALNDLASRQLDPDTATHAIGSGTLLIRTGNGRFSFVHQSVLEWLVARHIATGLTSDSGERLDVLRLKPMSDLTIEFLCGLAGSEVVGGWAAATISNRVETDAAKANALAILRKVGLTQQAPFRLARAHLPGRNLAGMDLRSADLTGADLTDADLGQADLRDAMLRGASLAGARLDRAQLNGADLTDANLTQARLLGADLRRTRTQHTRWRRAALVGAQMDSDDVSGLAAAGAAPPEAIAAQVQLAIAQGPVSLAIAVDTSGELLFTGDNDGVVCIWDVRTGSPLRALSGHTGRVSAAVAAPDGGWLATASDDRTVRIWSTTTGTTIRTLTGHTDAVTAIVAAPDASWLATASYDRSVRIWNMRTGATIRTLTGHTDAVTAIVAAPDASWLATASYDRSVRIWNMRTGATIRTLTGHTDAVFAVATAPDGTWLATASSDHTVRIWNTTTAETARTLTGRAGATTAVAIAPDGTWLATASSDHTVRIWNTTTGLTIRTLTGHSGAVTTITTAPDGTWLATASYDGTIRIWNTITGQTIRTLSGHTDAVLSIVSAPDGTWLATASSDHTVRIWNTTTGQTIRTLTGHSGAVTTITAAPDGTWLATASYDGTVRIWNTTTGATIRTVTGHTGAVTTITTAPDGTWLATASYDGTIRIWNTTTGQTIRTLTGHTSPVTTITTAPDGTWLATASYDGTIRIWNTTTGATVHMLAGHTGPVRAVAIAPNGTWLTTGGNDGTIRIWEVAGGTERATFIPLADGGSAVLLPDLSYKLAGVPAGEFWYAINLCRFEPGELDPYLPALRRLSADTSIWSA